MCIDPEISQTEVSRRGLLRIGGGLAVGAGAAGWMAPSMAQAAVSRGHTHTNRVVLLGVAGGPPPEIDRAGISSAVVVGDRVYVVDCGRGSVTQYAQSRLKFRNLKGIFVTHLHADHVIDFYDYAALPGFGVNDSDDGIVPPTGTDPRVQVYGPGSAGGLPPADDPALPTIAEGNPTPGIADLFRLQTEAFAYSTNLFMRRAGIPDPRTLFDIHEISHPDTLVADYNNRAPDMEPFVIHDDGVVRVSAILVPHGPVYPSYAFRFDSEEGSVVFSGDTAASDNIVRLAQGADMLVHEVIDFNFYVNFLGLDPALLQHLLRSHTDVHDLGPIAERAEVDHLVLTHLVPADPRLMSAGTWRKNVQPGYSGRVHVGDDLMSLPLLRRRRAG